MHVSIFYSLSYRIWVVQFLFSEVYNSFCTLSKFSFNPLLTSQFSKALRFTLLHIAWWNISSLHINKFCLHQSSWWPCRLRRVTKFCLLSWDLLIILWVTFRAHSLLFLPAKAVQNNFRKFEEHVFCDLWFAVSGFCIPVFDSGLWFLIPDSGFQILGLPGFYPYFLFKIIVF